MRPLFDNFVQRSKRRLIVGVNQRNFFTGVLVLAVFALWVFGIDRVFDRPWDEKVLAGRNFYRSYPVEIVGYHADDETTEQLRSFVRKQFAQGARIEGATVVEAQSATAPLQEITVNATNGHLQSVRVTLVLDSQVFEKTVWSTDLPGAERQVLPGYIAEAMRGIMADLDQRYQSPQY